MDLKWNTIKFTFIEFILMQGKYRNYELAKFSRFKTSHSILFLPCKRQWEKCHSTRPNAFNDVLVMDFTSTFFFRTQMYLWPVRTWCQLNWCLKWKNKGKHLMHQFKIYIKNKLFDRNYQIHSSSNHMFIFVVRTELNSSI